jgi:hypothetical protein
VEDEVTQQEAALNTIQAVAEAIRSLGSVPSGELYAHVMGQLSFTHYTNVIDILKRTGLVVEKSHLLTWVEPKS